jgi:hypothetical protein
MTLTVPKPQLSFDVSGGSACLEKPLTIKVGPVGVGVADLVTYGILPCRRFSASAAVEIWDEGTKSWKPDPGPALTGIKPGQLAFKDGDSQPWQGLIVAAVVKDQYLKSTGGFPQYFFRAVFSSKDAPELVVGPPSDNVNFVALAEKSRLVIGPGTDEKAESATIARMILNNPSFDPIGSIEIESESGSSKITISNSAHASVILHSNGQIELKPGGGQRVVINADLEADHIFCKHGGGSTRDQL